jgi:hypothetical protein
MTPEKGTQMPKEIETMRWAKRLVSLSVRFFLSHLVHIIASVISQERLNTKQEEQDVIVVARSM